MARTSRPLDFKEGRFGRGADKDVSVGAYARRQFRRRVLLGVFGAALIMGAFALYQLLKPPGQADQGERYPVRVRCVLCGHTAIVRVQYDQTFPMRCPECRELACQVMWQCRQCGHQFVPEQTGTILRCPECGSERVGSAATP